MKYLKLLASILSLILVVLGVCGCMSNDKNYDSAILEYLNGKYDADFQIIKSGMEFNGNDGSYFHAICKSADYVEDFSVYCYPEREEQGDKIIIDEIEYFVVDEYAEIVFQNKIQSDIEQLVSEEFFVRCQVEVSDYFISKQEYESGLETCIGNTDLYSHITVYLIGDSNKNPFSSIKAVEDYCLKLNPYRGYLYFANTTKDITLIDEHYIKNATTFDTHISECDNIKRVEFSLIKRGEGIAKKTIEKE